MQNSVTKQIKRGILFGLLISLVIFLILLTLYLAGSYMGNWIGCAGKLIKIGTCIDIVPRSEPTRLEPFLNPK